MLVTPEAFVTRVPFLACPLCDPCDKGDAISAPAAECLIQGIKPFSSASGKTVTFFVFFSPHPVIHGSLIPPCLACYPIDLGEASTLWRLWANAGATCGGCCPFLHSGGLPLQFAASSAHLFMILKFHLLLPHGPFIISCRPIGAPWATALETCTPPVSSCLSRPKCFPFGEPP